MKIISLHIDWWLILETVKSAHSPLWLIFETVKSAHSPFCGSFVKVLTFVVGDRTPLPKTVGNNSLNTLVSSDTVGGCVHMAGVKVGVRFCGDISISARAGTEHLFCSFDEASEVLDS